MKKNHNALLAVILSLAALDQSLVQANFFKSTFFNWGARNSAVSSNGNDVALVLNRFSGIKSYQNNLQLLQMSSVGGKHDEIDFEFLGNVTGQPYVIHTNVYTQGAGNREQQFYPWFDPTADFHNYTIHWNPTHIVWFVDRIPIRVFKNYESVGIPYPRSQPMRLFSSIWNADNWATRGGLVKIDWSRAPFVARFRHLRLRACRWLGQTSISECAASTPANWWTSPAHGRLGYAQEGQLMWVRNNFMIYDYCQDAKRFNGEMPPECSLQQV